MDAVSRLVGCIRARKGWPGLTSRTNRQLHVAWKRDEGIAVVGSSHGPPRAPHVLEALRNVDDRPRMVECAMRKAMSRSIASGKLATARHLLRSSRERARAVAIRPQLRGHLAESSGKTFVSGWRRVAYDWLSGLMTVGLGLV